MDWDRFGSIFAKYVLYAIWEFSLFNRIMNDPVKGRDVSLIGFFWYSPGH